MARSVIRPPLTAGGKQRAWLLSDAPRALKQVGRSMIGAHIHGPAMVGAWVRGWCDGVRLRDVDDNPYARAGSGWHQAAANLYRDGWRAGKQCERVEHECTGMTDQQYQRVLEVRDRARAIIRSSSSTSTSSTELSTRGSLDDSPAGSPTVRTD